MDNQFVSVLPSRKGKREYLNDPLTNELMRELNAYLESKVEVPRIRHGSKQTLETLINEEALLLAKYLRNERKTEEEGFCYDFRLFPKARQV